MIGTQEVTFIALGLVCTIVSWIKLRPVYSVWMTGNWILFVCVSFVLSVPRYTLTMFPIFILFAMLAARRVRLAKRIWIAAAFGILIAALRLYVAARERAFDRRRNTPAFAEKADWQLQSNFEDEPQIKTASRSQ